MAMSRTARMAIMANSSRNGGNQRNEGSGNYRRDGGGDYQRNEGGGNYQRDGGRQYQREEGRGYERGEYRNEGGRGYQRGRYDEMGGDYGERTMRTRERYDEREGGMRRDRGGMRRGREWDDDDDDDYVGAYGGQRSKQRMRRSGMLAWEDPAVEDEELPEHLDQAKAQEYVKKMKQADGRMGEKWKMEQTEQVRQQWCPDCNKYDFYVAINMMAADYGKTAQKFGVDKPEFYACLAKDFLNDPDAKSAKIVRYMKAIPE